MTHVDPHDPLQPPLLRALTGFLRWVGGRAVPRVSAQGREARGRIIEARRPSGVSTWVTRVDGGG